MTTVVPDPDTCYRALSSRDARFDGWFFAGIRSTGIYCRPSCPARTPLERNCRWFPSAAAAQQAGFRACRRCHPDAVPGSPSWRFGADAAARAMRMIADGVVDREGVAGVASRLGYSPRQVQRLLLDHAGATPLALARSQRAHTARVLLQRTTASISDIAFQAGFGSLRQFNDTIREVYAATPQQLRGTAPEPQPGADGTGGGLELRLAARQPFDAPGLLDFFGTRVVTGLESRVGDRFARAVRLPGGAAVVEVRPGDSGLVARVALTDWRDLGALVARLRAWCDLDADPYAIDDVLGGHAATRAMVDRVPGIRLPGTPDPDELAVRCLVGQQISLAGATTVTAKLVKNHGEPLPADLVDIATGWGHQLSYEFPTMGTLAALNPDTLPMPRSRGRALVGLADALASGQVSLAAGADRLAARASLESLRGIGPWTGGYVALRALGDPDVLLDTDLVIARQLAAIDLGDHAWLSPWRSYLTVHLWRRASQQTHPRRTL